LMRCLGRRTSFVCERVCFRRCFGFRLCSCKLFGTQLACPSLPVDRKLASHPCRPQARLNYGQTGSGTGSKKWVKVRGGEMHISYRTGTAGAIFHKNTFIACAQTKTFDRCGHSKMEHLCIFVALGKNTYAYNTKQASCERMQVWRTTCTRNVWSVCTVEDHVRTMTGPGALRPVMLRIGTLQVVLLFCPDFQGLLSMSRSLQCLASVISIAAIAATREIARACTQAADLAHSTRCPSHKHARW